MNCVLIKINILNAFLEMICIQQKGNFGVNHIIDCNRGEIRQYPGCFSGDLFLLDLVTGLLLD